MASAASLNYLGSSARRFLSSAYHHRAAPPPVNTVQEPQRAYSITILPDRMRLPDGTSFIQVALFDITFREPLGLPLRFRVNEAGEVAAEAFGEHFVRALGSDRIYLVVEAVMVNEEPTPDRPFKEEALASGWFPLGMRAQHDKKATSDISLFRGSAASHLCSAQFRANTDPKAQTLGAISLSTANVGKAAPSDMIFPAYRFVPARVVGPDVVAGRGALNVMKVSVDSFSVRFGDGRGANRSGDTTGSAATAAAVIAGSAWSLVAMTHSGFKPLSGAVGVNLTQHPTAQDVLRTAANFVVDTDTPIHETSHLVLVLRRETPAGPVGTAVGVLPLCPKVQAVRDAVVRVPLLPMMAGPFVPAYDANAGHCVARPAAASAMFQRSDWSCAIMLRIENTPTPAPRRPGSMKSKRHSSTPQLPQQLDDSGAGQSNNGSTQQRPQPLRSRPANSGMTPAKELAEPEQERPRVGAGKKPGKKLSKVPMTQMQDYADEPALLPTEEQPQAAGAAGGQHTVQVIHQHHGGGGGSAAVSDAQLKEMQGTILSLRKEMFGMLSDITRDLHGVTKEVNFMYRTGAGAQAAMRRKPGAGGGGQMDPIALMDGGGEDGAIGVNVPAQALGGQLHSRNKPRPAFRVADAPLCRSQAALSTSLRNRLLDRQRPIRHPKSREPLANESVLCSQSLPDTRFCVRINGITLNTSLLEKANSAIHRVPAAAGINDDVDDTTPAAEQKKVRAPPRKFAFRVYCGVAVQQCAAADLAGGSAACEAPLPALTGVVIATSDAGEVLYATRLDAQDADTFAAHRPPVSSGGPGPHAEGDPAQLLAPEESAARDGYWLEPSAPDTDVHLRGTIPAYVRKMRCDRAALNYSTTPACLTIEVLDGNSRFPIGYATLPIDAFQRPPTTTHTVREEDLVVRSEASFCRDASMNGNPAADGSGGAGGPTEQATCPAFRPHLGSLHVTACAIGYEAPRCNSGLGGSPTGLSSSPTVRSGSASAPPPVASSLPAGTVDSARSSSSSSNGGNSGRTKLGVVEVPRLGSAMHHHHSSSMNSGREGPRYPTPPNLLNSSTASQKQQQQKTNPDGSAFLAAPRLTHLHSKRVEVLKSTMMSSPRNSNSATFGGNGGADHDAMVYQSKVLERQRDERKHDLIQDALQRRMQLDASVVCPVGRPAIADFAFRNPYPATMAFTLEFVKNSDAAVGCEAVVSFGHSFVCAPLEEKTVQVCVRAKGGTGSKGSVPRTGGGPDCQCRVRVLDDKGEVVKVLCATAIVLPPQVDRVVRIYGGPGSTVGKDIFVRCYNQHLVVAAEKGDVGLSKLRHVINNLCAWVHCTGENAGKLVEKAHTKAEIQYLVDGGVATWEELHIDVTVPQSPTTLFVHLYSDQQHQNCLLTWALRVTPVQVINTPPILCGQTNTFTIPLPNFRSVYCTNGSDPDMAVSAAIVPVTVSHGGGALSPESVARAVAGTQVQLRARPLKPHVYSVLLHAAENEAAAQAGRILVAECRIPAQMAAATFARTMHVAPRATPLFLRVLVRNEDAQRQRVFRVVHNLEAFVSVRPNLFMLGPGDQQPVSVSVALAALSAGHGTQAAKYPLRLTVTDNDDKISDVFQIDLIVDPAAVSIENMEQ